MLDPNTVRALRELHGLSYRKLGSKVGCSRTMLYFLERGLRPFTPELEGRLLAFFKVTDQKTLNAYLELYSLMDSVRDRGGEMKNE